MLSGIFKIKTNARAMLTANIDLQDRLGNGLIGTVMHITRNSQGISKIYLKFSDARGRIKAMIADIFGK